MFHVPCRRTLCVLTLSLVKQAKFALVVGFVLTVSGRASAYRMLAQNPISCIPRIGINEYARLCTSPIPCILLAAKWYPATSQLAQLALTDVTYMNSILLCSSKTAESCATQPLSNTMIKSDEEEQSVHRARKISTFDNILH